MHNTPTNTHPLGSPIPIWVWFESCGVWQMTLLQELKLPPRLQMSELSGWTGQATLLLFCMLAIFGLVSHQLAPNAEYLRCVQLLQSECAVKDQYGHRRSPSAVAHSFQIYLMCAAGGGGEEKVRGLMCSGI